jgi:hypothetical protein
VARDDLLGLPIAALAESLHPPEIIEHRLPAREASL